MSTYLPVGRVLATDPQTRALVQWVLRLSGALRIDSPRSRYVNEALIWLESEGLVAPAPQPHLDAATKALRHLDR